MDPVIQETTERDLVDAEIAVNPYADDDNTFLPMVNDEGLDGFGNEIGI